MPHPTIAVENLRKSFGEHVAVSELSFTIARGSAFGLLGPNGSGKTTTIRLLNGLLTPDAGTITIFGKEMTKENADTLRQSIGVQTDTNLYDMLSARENLRIWGALYGLDRHSLGSRVDAILDTFNLTSRADSLVGEFSKGMRQKLAIGRAVIHEPELLFLDEPTAGLDPEAAAELINYVKAMIQSRNTTVVISTHQLAGLETLCDDIGIIDQGRLLSAGNVNDLLERTWPGHRYSLSFEGNWEIARRIVGSLTTIDEETKDEIKFRTTHDDAISEIVAALVRADIAVRAVIPQHPTIEEFYFTTLNKEAGA